MNIIFSLIVTIVSCFIVYSLFDKSGFKAGLIFKFLLQLGIYLINGSLTKLYNLGLLYFIIILLTVFVIIFVTTAIEYFVYNRTNSFFTYLILSAIIEFLVAFGISFVLVFIMNLLMWKIFQ